MANDQDGMRIPMQVGTELRIKNTGEIIVDNPELELQNPDTADAVLAYSFDAKAGIHVLRLLEPVANHKHLRAHHRGD
jgi:hypothetical protein